MDEYREFAKRAVEDLLDTCPEFRPAWDANEWLLLDDGGVGLYGVFGQIILPFLSYALPASPKSAKSSYGSGNDAEDMFRQNPEWRDIPDSQSPEFEDLLRRLYETFEHWADSPNSHIRESVYIELVETGYEKLSIEDLTVRGGPLLQSLKERSPNPTSRSESSNDSDGIS